MDLYAEEAQLRAQGYSLIAGVDEVGRGCLAGPVFAAAVILPPELRIKGLNDSKKLRAKQREEISQIILQKADAYCIRSLAPKEIDRLNIFQASLQAMYLALEGLSQKPDLALIDGKFPVPNSLPQKTFIAGDGRVACIAAASIIAKVARDRYMSEREADFPQFSFAKHKGYGTAQHLKELREHGPCDLHRYSFAPVREC